MPKKRIKRPVSVIPPGRPPVSSAPLYRQETNADVMREQNDVHAPAKIGHHQIGNYAIHAPGRQGQTPIQMDPFWKTWWNKMTGGNNQENQRLRVDSNSDMFYDSSMPYQAPRIRSDSERHGDEQFQIGREATSSGLPGKLKKGITGGKGIASAGGQLSRFANYWHASQDADNAKDAFGVSSGVIGAGGALLDAGLDIHDMATSDRKKKDKALTGLDVVGNLGKATTSGASSVAKAAKLFGHTMDYTPVAAVGSIVTGSANLLSGGIGAGMAHHRMKKLEQARDDMGEHHSDYGLARFAADAQKGKRRSNLLKALGGGATLGAGIALALGAGPVGWGLLAAAGGIGLGIKAYKMYKKHKDATRLLEDPRYLAQLRAAGINTNLDRQLDNEKWYKQIPFMRNTRKYNNIRGQVAGKLAAGTADQGGSRDNILKHLGLKNEYEDSGSMFYDDQRKMHRKEQIAKMLEY
ncbi:MAG: hypothetical protein QNK37_10980 [Acidobacteriota bacterium]|nr:hypothetical protein [Acidobacteriota bacterium]